MGKGMEEGSTKEESEEGKEENCAAGSYMQLRPGSWLAERIEMYVCSHLFLTVADESEFRTFRMLVPKLVLLYLSCLGAVDIWRSVVD